ncbi:hypothetical protein [Chroococcidiopsis sp. CCMEE 29]|uniref:hypothetical protein n=1 Tax=Chroococcidiopsis sp. CCMEE 29 TaxID=155894 RepID=UPI0020204630|nr:hypothetical protein [Chroococcidiopsis sp. CCMEE 29]
MNSYEYNIDQQRIEQQQDAEAAYQQQRWEQGYDDVIAGVWKGCNTKTEDCSRYCKYLAGYLWGMEQKTIQYHAECRSNLAVLDSEDYDEF